MFKKFLLVGASMLFLTPVVIVQAEDTSVIISNEKVSIIGPQTVSVTWTTNVPANARVVYGPVAQAIAEGAQLHPQYGYSSTTAEISSIATEHMVVAGPIMGGMTYFRPVSSVGTTTAIGREVSINPAVLSGSCAYVTSYLKRGGENNPGEVKNLQAFLRGVEKDATVSVNGVFDDATYEGVKKFQLKYKDDILSAWGVGEPTGYVYITTKRKINEIFCSTKIALTQEEQLIINTPHIDKKIDSTMEIGKGTTITDNGLLATENSVTNATGTGIIAEIESDSMLNKDEENLTASAGGIREFFSKNQFLVLILFVLAFVGIYLFGNKGESRIDEKKTQKIKESNIREYEQ
ncbi:MAG: hypothetical protein Q7S11_04175 [bacterium]|nr:hypothetical protein [bacterium]